MQQLECPACSLEITPLQALACGSFSWPLMASWWVICPHCQAGSHFRAEPNVIAQYVILGAPGPNWEETRRVAVPGLTLRADPSFLHIWHLGKHYEFPARV